MMAPLRKLRNYSAYCILSCPVELVMKRWPFLAVLMLTMLYTTTTVMALGGEYGKGHEIESTFKDWPKGLQSALASQEHEGGEWVNSNDFYWFSGDTQALNRFLAASAKIEGAPVYIRFHSGKGEGKSFSDKPPIAIDWQMSTFMRGWSEEWPENSPTEYMVRIDVWDGRQVNKQGVVIPTGIIQQSETSTQPTTRPLASTQPQRSPVIKLSVNDIPYSSEVTMKKGDAVSYQLPSGKVVAVWCHKSAELGEQRTASGLKTVWGEKPFKQPDIRWKHLANGSEQAAGWDSYIRQGSVITRGDETSEYILYVDQWQFSIIEDLRAKPSLPVTIKVVLNKEK